MTVSELGVGCLWTGIKWVVIKYKSSALFAATQEVDGPETRFGGWRWLWMKDIRGKNILIEMVKKILIRTWTQSYPEVSVIF
jgi:hypothetical protein